MIVFRVFVQTVALALGQIWANKVRALLTALGIIVGVASVAAVISALTGMKSFVLGEFESFGTKRIFIDDYYPPELRGRYSWRRTLLKEGEIQALIDNAPAVALLTPIRMGNYEVAHGDMVIQTASVTGIWPEWHEIENRFVDEGRPFMRIDEEERRQVCLINQDAVEELELDRNPVGEHIIVDGRRFLIVGKVETKDSGAMFQMGGDSRAEFFIPLSVAKKLNQRGHINHVMGEITSTEEADAAEAQITSILRKVRNLEPGTPDTFKIEVMQQHLEQFKSVSGALTAVAAGIVGISLLVGGIGIMNIMLVSVSERTREIGLRKAVGALPSIILMQFLTEAVVLCMVGGLVGLVVGQGFTLIMQNIPGANLEGAAIPPWAIALAFAFSAGVGVVFGMFPAIKASRLDPIDALRHE